MGNTARILGILAILSLPVSLAEARVLAVDVAGQQIRNVNLADSNSRIDLIARQKVRAALNDPNIALIFLALGALGIYVEFLSPGLILPGTAGSVLAMLGLSGLSVLPLNRMGVGLVLLALTLFALEAKVAAPGILSAGAAVSLVLGAWTLVDCPAPELRIHVATVLGVVAPMAILTAILVTLAGQARRNKVVTVGHEGYDG